MDAIILAVIIFVAIAGPTLLALALYWRNNPDRRLSWRRAAENAADTDPEHFRRPSAQWLFFGVAAAAATAEAAEAAEATAVPANSQLDRCEERDAKHASVPLRRVRAGEVCVVSGDASQGGFS